MTSTSKRIQTQTHLNINTPPLPTQPTNKQMNILEKQTMKPIISFQSLLPHCFNTPTTTSTPSSSTIRVISTDGKTKTYTHPIPASTLLSQHPSHQICHSDSFFIGHKLTSLSPDDRLQLGQSYFLLPTNFFNTVLSFMALTKSSIWSFEVKKNERGLLQVRVRSDDEDHNNGDGFKPKGSEEPRTKLRICDNEELEKEYRAMKGRQWKPRLETISEKKVNGISKWLLVRRKMNV